MMSLAGRFLRFIRKSPSDKWAAVKATFFHENSAERRRLHRLLIGPHAPPRILQTDERIYVAYRPDSDVFFKRYPEMAHLSEKWVKNNVMNNAGDLPRLYALTINIKQVLDDDVAGDMAELGVYRGNSAALLAHYAREYKRTVLLFDTFEGFDDCDLIGVDKSKAIEFADTSLKDVRDLVGEERVRFVQGRFPQSIPPDLHASRFSVVHIDCDLYEPAKAGLEYFYPRLSPGGLIIVHDYGNPYWSGIKRAVDEYCQRIPERPVLFGDKCGTAMLRRHVEAGLEKRVPLGQLSQLI
jgi:SAM-dependent methyltransferase